MKDLSNWVLLTEALGSVIGHFYGKDLKSQPVILCMLPSLCWKADQNRLEVKVDFSINMPQLESSE